MSLCMNQNIRHHWAQSLNGRVARVLRNEGLLPVARVAYWEKTFREQSFITTLELMMTVRLSIQEFLHMRVVHHGDSLKSFYGQPSNHVRDTGNVFPVIAIDGRPRNVAPNMSSWCNRRSSAITSGDWETTLKTLLG